MASDSNTRWRQLGSCDPASLTEARLQCHHAAQLLTRVARGYVPAKPDDSHTNLGWDHSQDTFLSRPTEPGGFQLGLRLEDLRLSLLGPGGELEADWALSGRTLREASEWVAGQLDSKGLDSGSFDEPLHFDIPHHPVADGQAFSVDEGPAFAELSRYYANAASLIVKVAKAQPGSSEVRCWPHHFDIATLITLRGPGESATTIGFGMSPGDSSYGQPYFYISPWPAPESSQLPALDAGAHWHTEGFTGAIVVGEDLARQASSEGQGSWLESLAVSVIADLRSLATRR